MSLKLTNLLGKTVLLLKIEFPKNINFFRFKSFKKDLDYSKVPVLNEADLEIQFIRGSGPGGQSINKTSSCVLLKHKPSGLVVKNQETRSQFQNQKKARLLMIDKLDVLYNKENSIQNQKKVLMDKISQEQNKRKQRMAELKKAFKEREGLT